MSAKLFRCDHDYKAIRRHPTAVNGLSATSTDSSEDAISIGHSDSVNMNNVPTEAKGKRPLHQSLWILLADYSMNSSVHGVRYVFEQRRHWSERLWWVIALVLAVCGCGRLIMNVYDKWEHSPVIVTFAENTTPVWEIPFPAVTICPETKAISALLNYTQVFHMVNEAGRSNVTSEQFQQLLVLLQVCGTNVLNISLNEEFASCTIFQKIREIMPAFDSIVFRCFFRNQMTPCTDMFQMVMTDEGLCYTFNMLDPRELYRDTISEEFLVNNKLLGSDSSKRILSNSLHQSTPQSPYPFRLFGSGKRAGIFIMMSLDGRNFDYLCRNIQGVKMALHAPDETPQMANTFFHLSLDVNVQVAIKPNVMTTSKRLRNYEPNRRQCYFETERHLRFYRIYKQRNCELECLTNYTMQKCGCVKFSMPRNTNTPVCGASTMRCYNEAANELQKQEFAHGLAGRSVEMGCNCLPDCTSITYDAEMTQTRFSWKEIYKAHKKPMAKILGKYPCGLSIFYKEKQFISSHRTELFGPTEFMANCGGLIGLFMGVSILSIVEIIYYCTLRLFCIFNERPNRRDELRRRTIDGSGDVVVSICLADKPQLMAY